MDPNAQGANAFVISIILVIILVFYYGGDKIMGWWNSNTSTEEVAEPKEKSAFWTVVEKVTAKKEEPSSEQKKIVVKQEKKVAATQPKPVQPAPQPKPEPTTSQMPYPSYGVLNGGTSYYSDSSASRSIGTYPGGAEIDIIDWPNGGYAMISYNGFSGWVSKASISNLQDAYGVEWVKK